MVGAPGTATALDPQDLGLRPPAPYCPDQGEQEPRSEYAGRVLAYALAYGTAPLSMSQLETADAQAVRIIAGLPQKVDAYAYTSLDEDGARLYATLHTLRVQLAARMDAKRAQLAALQRLMDAAEQEPPDQGDAPDEPEETDQDRAIKLLRAALTLIMQPGPGNGGGGRPARLQPPVPVRPGPLGGNHADDPSTAARVTATEQTLKRPADDIAF